MRADRGQALVEFALVLPMICAMLLAVVLVAEIGVARLALEHGAAEGARTGALTNDDALVRGTVAATVGPLDAAKVHVNIDPPQDHPPRTGDPRGTLLHVTLRYTIPMPLAFVGLSSLAIHGDAARRIEWSP
jgi:TadE-like protein